MAGQIFYRERLNAREGSKTPRYRIVAVCGVDLKVYADHLRMAELKQIAMTTQADLIPLQRGPKHQGAHPETAIALEA
jgi:hypothetical protein